MPRQKRFPFYCEMIADGWEVVDARDGKAVAVFEVNEWSDANRLRNNLNDSYELENHEEAFGEVDAFHADHPVPPDAHAAINQIVADASEDDSSGDSTTEEWRRSGFFRWLGFGR